MPFITTLLIIFTLSGNPVKAQSMTSTPASRHWDTYLQKTLNAPPQATLLHALKNIPSDGKQKTAIDLGCGGGRDTIELLKNGWHVIAIDREQICLDAVQKRAFDIHKQDRLTLDTQGFENLSLQPFPQADLINASYCLPFCHPNSFKHLWREIVDSIKDQGYFSGHFFGLNHTRPKTGSMTFLSEDQVLNLFDGFKIIHFQEEECDEEDCRGVLIHWHVYHVVARKESGR